MNWSVTISTVIFTVLAIIAVAFLLYALVRLAGSAWYKSKMEYHQKILRNIKPKESRKKEEDNERARKSSIFNA